MTPAREVRVSLRNGRWRIQCLIPCGCLGVVETNRDVGIAGAHAAALMRTARRGHRKWREQQQPSSETTTTRGVAA